MTQEEMQVIAERFAAIRKISLEEAKRRLTLYGLRFESNGDTTCQWCGEEGGTRFVVSPPVDGHPAEEAYMHDKCAGQAARESVR